jgi:hypothetical protein
LTDLPLATDYIVPRAERVAAWQTRLAAAPGSAPRLKAGIAWAGNPAHRNDRNRSVALARLRPLLEIDRVAWHSLQVGPRTADLKEQDPLVRDLSPLLSDFTDTAAAIAGLDLVVSVDTAVAHLAAAIGKRTWVLLPATADWRWLSGRTDSPWYPNVRLFRQPAAGDWESVATTAAAALRDLVG